MVKQHHKRFLGMPFSKCIDKDPTKHPENDFYTRETCREFDYAQDDFHFKPLQAHWSKNWFEIQLKESIRRMQL